MAVTAKTVTITVNSPGGFTDGYQYFDVQYKLQSTSVWTTLNPIVTASPVVISPLPVGQDYDLRIRGNDGGVWSDYVTETFST